MALAATAIFGAIGGWVGSGVAGGVTSTVSSTFSGLRFSNLTSWIPSAIGYGTGTAIGSTVTTGLLDVTNIVNPSSQDYINGMAFGLLFGGIIGTGNYSFHTNFSVPVGVIGEGSYFFTTTPIPQGNESR